MRDDEVNWFGIHRNGALDYLGKAIDFDEIVDGISESGEYIWIMTEQDFENWVTTFNLYKEIYCA